MKENWTYKKLGDVGTVIGGGTPKTDNPEFWEGDLAWITPAELDGSKYVSSTVRTITEKAREKTNLTLLPIGTVLLSSRAPIGKVSITKIPMYCNQGFKNIVCSDELNNEYLYWWLKGKNEYLNSLGVGATFKEISKRIVEQITIPIPPLETQSRIVSELDLLQSFIDKQKAQLKELDNLAQSIFYDMFGNPVENEKGWDVKKIGNLCDVYRGGSPRPIEKFLGGTIPWIKIGDATKGDDIYLHQTKEHIIEEGLKKTRYIHSGSLIFANCGVSLGFARIITFNGCIHDGWLAFDNISNEIEKVFFLKSLNFCTQYFRSIAPDGTQPNLNTAIMKSFNQILPPLEIQKSYIEKTEAIEHQKAAISQSIAETQKLFDYTMDKYFGE